MENRELIDQIYYLREKADNNKLAVFVGAGVSCNVQGMPSWAELVAKMAKEVGYVKCIIVGVKRIVNPSVVIAKL